jgi:hypothetical protein
VLREKQDQVKIPASAMAVKDPALVLRAGAALKTIAERPTTWERIVPQSAQDLDAAYRQVRDLYRRAFEWESESAARPPYADVARSMRMHVREWITRWDLERLDPSYSAHIETELMRPDLSEREGLEGFSGAMKTTTATPPIERRPLATSARRCGPRCEAPALNRERRHIRTSAR